MNARTSFLSWTDVHGDEYRFSVAKLSYEWHTSFRELVLHLCSFMVLNAESFGEIRTSPCCVIAFLSAQIHVEKQPVFWFSCNDICVCHTRGYRASSIRCLLVCETDLEIHDLNEHEKPARTQCENRETCWKCSVWVQCCRPRLVL